MSNVWIDGVVVVALPDSATSVSTGKRVVLISQFNLCWATNRARGSAFFFIISTEFVLHLCLLDREQLSNYRS